MYIANKIIDKCEKSIRDWEKGRTGNRSIKVEEEDYQRCGKSKFIEEAKELEAKGLVSLKWVIRGSDIKKIEFSMNQIDQFYQLVGREPKWKQVERKKVQLENELKAVSKEWIKKYYEDLIFRNDPKNKLKMPDNVEFYFPVFRGLDQLDAPIYKRIFSRTYMKNSKSFEQEAESYIISKARKFCEDVEDEMDKTQVLSQIYIEEYSQEMEVKGPLCIRLQKDGEYETVNLNQYFYGTVLNSQTLENAEILSEQPDIQKIVTIENKANFVSAPYDKHTLYIFTHGYFSPRERRFLQKLNIVLQNQEVEFYHSGDLDYGGIKIFEYIKSKIFNRLQPLQMDVITYRKYLKYGEKISGETLNKLKKIELPEFQNLIQEMLKEEMVIEQECFLIQEKGE